jgi:hypothetical protein
MIAAITKKEKEKETNEQLALQSVFESIFKIRIQKELKKIAIIAANRFKKTEDFPNNFIVSQHQETLIKLFNKLYAKVVHAFAQRNFNHIPELQGKNHIPTFEKKQTEDEMLEDFRVLSQNWIKTEGLRQAKNIAKTTEKDIISIISKGKEEGESINAIVKNIIDKVGTEIARTRAEAIAITEVHNASTFADMTSTDLLNKNFQLKLKKIWIPVEDARTRPDHALMINHPPIEIDDFFFVPPGIGVQMLRPGDPAGGADQVIRCRCVLIYE